MQQKDQLDFVREKRMEKRNLNYVQKLPFDHPTRLYLEDEERTGMNKITHKHTLSLRNTIGKFLGMKQYDPTEEAMKLEAGSSAQVDSDKQIDSGKK